MNIRSEVGSLTYDLATLGANPWFKQDLLTEVKSEPNRALRLAKTAVLTGALKAGELGANVFYARVATRSYQRAGHEVVGMGYHTVVIKEDEKLVRKIYHRTHRWSTERLSLESARLLEAQESVLDEFPDSAIPQSVTIGEFPLDPTRHCLVAQQDYIKDGIPVDFLHPSDAARDFLEDSCAMYDRTGSIPDIVGLANVFDTPSGLKIIDTIPLSAENPRDFNALRHAFTILALHGFAPSEQHISE